MSKLCVAADNVRAWTWRFTLHQPAWICILLSSASESCHSVSFILTFFIMLAEVWNSIDDTRPTWRCRGAILKARLIRNGLDYIALCQSANQFIQYLQMLHISWQILSSKNIFVQTVLKLGMGMGGGDHWISLPWREGQKFKPLDKTCPLWVFKSETAFTRPLITKQAAIVIGAGLCFQN